MIKESDEVRAKAWCFDNGMTKEQMEQAWDNAIKAGNKIIINLSEHDHKWYNLQNHLLKQLVERYL